MAPQRRRSSHSAARRATAARNNALSQRSGLALRTVRTSDGIFRKGGARRRVAVVVVARFLGEPLEQITVLFTVKVLSHAVLAARKATESEPRSSLLPRALVPLRRRRAPLRAPPGHGSSTCIMSLSMGQALKRGRIDALLARVRPESHSFRSAIRKHDARFDFGIGGGQVNEIANFGAQLDVAVGIEKHAEAERYHVTWCGAATKASAATGARTLADWYLPWAAASSNATDRRWREPRFGRGRSFQAPAVAGVCLRYSFPPAPSRPVWACQRPGSWRAAGSSSNARGSPLNRLPRGKSSFACRLP